jgi:hypothetical protein
MPRGNRVVDSHGVINNLRTILGDLSGQRDTIDAQINAIENTLSTLGAVSGRRGPRGPAGTKAGGRRGGRGHREGSLKDYIVRVLSGGGIMRVNEVASGVLAAGFKTRNKTLAKSVGVALSTMPNVAKRGRGKYKLK